MNLQSYLADLEPGKAPHHEAALRGTARLRSRASRWWLVRYFILAPCGQPLFQDRLRVRADSAADALDTFHCHCSEQLLPVAYPTVEPA